jgi:hypothetical protein
MYIKIVFPLYFIVMLPIADVEKAKSKTVCRGFCTFRVSLLPGKTVFPEAPALQARMSSEWSDCAH